MTHWNGALLLALKFLHVLVATLWVGGTAFFAFIVTPAVATSSKAVRRELQWSLTMRTFKFAHVLGGLTILTGAVYTYALWDGFHPVGRPGRLILAGLLASVTVLVLLSFSAKPAAKALQDLSAKSGDLPASQGMMVLQHKLAFSARACLVLLLGTLGAMVWAGGL